MPNAAVLTCPRCGAVLNPEPTATRVQCQYCGSIAQVTETRLPGTPAAQPAASVARTRNFTLIWLGVVVAISLFTSFIGFRRAASISGEPSLSAFAAEQGGIRIAAPNLKAVDPAELVRQAGAAVRQRASNCELTYAYIGAVQAGTLDTTGSTSLIEWTCRSVDPQKPPGQDVADDEWDVRVLGGDLMLKKSTSGSHNNPPWKEPSCAFSEAWAAAVRSGVPANAVVSVYYREGRGLGRDRPMVWSLSVNGHPEFDRQIDGASCTVTARN